MVQNPKFYNIKKPIFFYNMSFNLTEIFNHSIKIAVTAIAIPLSKNAKYFIDFLKIQFKEVTYLHVYLHLKIENNKDNP